MIKPDVRELESFVAVAEHLNFSRAARQLHLSQPPLTRHIQSLEAKLGVELFIRDTRSVQLTETGRHFLIDARAILNRLESAADAARRSGTGEPERLRLGFVGALLDNALLAVIRAFRDRCPDCQVQVADLSPAAQMEAIRAGELDGGFIGAKPEKSDLLLHVWKSEPLLAALPEEHPLAAQTQLAWKDLRGQRWVMISAEAGPAFRRQFAELGRLHRLEPQIMLEAERAPAVLTMVAAGSGISLVPASMAQLVSTGIAFRPLAGRVPLLQHTFAHRKSSGEGVLAQFLQMLKPGKRARV